MTNEQFFTGAVLRQTDAREYTRKDGTRAQIATFMFEDATTDRPQQKLVRVWDATTAQWLRGNIGKEVTVRFDTSVREYNGRYYEEANGRFVAFEGRNVRELPLEAQTQEKPGRGDLPF